MVFRPEQITNKSIKSNYVESILGEKIHPIIQQEGVWDIDYPWQIPHVEKWLRQNQFTETRSIYEEEKIRIGSSKKNEKTQTEEKRLLITTVPFGEIDSKVLKMLEAVGHIKYTINPLNRKLKEDELREMIPDYDLLIAGTEPITKKVLENAHKLKLISRVGIGLDSVDLNAARDLGIKVSYTPDAPSPAVAELTIGHMLNLLRHIPSVDRNIRAGIWSRFQGQRLANMTIGVIGTGRIGMRVLKHLQGFSPAKILVNDLNINKELYKVYNAEYVEKEELYAASDIITLHVPLTKTTKDLIGLEQIELMKTSALLINTSRGGIINEDDLFEALSSNRIAGAAIDVFESEPYAGNLVELENCYFTCHMGSMTTDCRATMEIEASKEVIRYVNGEDLLNSVPEAEYQSQLEEI
ncbi:MAG: phosphoglycerate dehydrogenase [Candidatus Marinimicrobia bacterium]|nr:phosphoglycerate dehydrogenase [Candidatus Neomarinimicrobiota bacterium]